MMGRPKTCIDVLKICEHCKKKFYITESDNRRGRGKYCKLKCHHEHQSSFINESFFTKPNAEMAYVLGLIITDGCILKTESGSENVSIKSIDKQVLEKVNEMMKSQYGIYNCGLSDAGNIVWRIQVGSKKIVSDVKKWGITARKTFSAEFPNLPKRFHPDFIRGIFDGDGGAYGYKYPNQIHTQLCLLGTKKLLEGVVSSSGMDAEIKPYRNISKVVCYAWNKLKSFYDFIYYADDVPCLIRKKTDFQNALQLGSLENRQAHNTEYGKRSAENRKARKLAKETLHKTV